MPFKVLLGLFLIMSPKHSYSQLTHSGEWVENPRANKSVEDNSATDWDSKPLSEEVNPTLQALAKSADAQLTSDKCDSSSTPPGGLKCAFQATKIIENAIKFIQIPMRYDGPSGGSAITLSQFDGSDAVVGVVDDMLKEKDASGSPKWKVSDGPCPARIPGSIVFTNPEFVSGDDVRSHIGVVGEDGNIVHNQGQGGKTGCLIKSSPGDGQANWYKNVRCLVPADFSGV